VVSVRAPQHTSITDDVNQAAPGKVGGPQCSVHCCRTLHLNLGYSYRCSAWHIFRVYEIHELVNLCEQPALVLGAAVHLR
jgi:hypothetical protein